MARTNYDDWNISSKDNTSAPYNPRAVSFVFSVALLTIVITSIVNVFSVTFVMAIEAGLSSYSYVIYYLAYIAIGVILGLLVYVLPRTMLDSFSLLLSLLSIVVLWFTALGKVSFEVDETVYAFVFISNAYYLSSFFSKRGNSLESLRKLTVPIVLCTLTLGGIIFNSNITFSVLYVLMVLMIMRKCSVKIPALLLVLAYFLIPVICWAFSSQNNLNTLFRFGTLRFASTPSQHSLRLSCLTSSDWIGRGIGLGEYKASGIEGITGPYIICNILNEAGYIGLAVILVAFGAMIMCMKRYSRYSYSNDLYASNLCSIFSSYLFFQLVFNLLQTFDIVPMQGISMPFYSFSVNVSFMIMVSFICYRCLHQKSPRKVDETKKFDINDDEFGDER